jgi:S-DNA-T family DNA segregation ATPase FtsK/SpoIIIE
LTLDLADGPRDCWAEDGTTLRQVLTDLGLDATGPFNHAIDRPLPPGALVVRADPAAPAPTAGGWRLVALGGPDAGRELNLRSATAPVRAGPTRRGRVRLARPRPVDAAGGAGPVWLGRVRRTRSGGPRATWHRLLWPRRAAPATLLRTAAGDLFALIREPVPSDGEETQNLPKRPWRQAAVSAATGIAMAGVMFAMTRNPVWALMPLAGVLATVIPALARTPKPPWVADVVGLDPAAPSPLVPGAVLELIGPQTAAAALARRLIAHRLSAGTASPSITVPREPGWEWARFAPEAPPRGPDLLVERTDRGLRLTSAADWPADAPAPGWDASQAAPVRLVVRDAGLGIVAARGVRGETSTAAGMASGPLEELLRPGPTPCGPAPAAPFPLDAAQIAASWAAGAIHPLGTAADGAPVVLDLARDGPHALVAGTSGSGKSEFLRALMLAEAVRTPPDRLGIVGLDHKGGATFRDLEHLPHVVGVATDLDAAGTARVLTSLEAELANRERLLERHAVASWLELAPTDRPPRLLVVVDEFRTLLEALPEAAARLERLAAQGRSLGMGLLLATQRPAGAVSAQLRANLALRICFRVAGEADSMDVIGGPDAARVDPDLPGTCVVVTAGRPPTTLRVRQLPPPARRRATPATWPDTWAPPAPTIPTVAALARAVARAAAAAGAAPAAAPWRPPLPAQLDWSRLPPVPAGRVALGLADIPERQIQEPWTWDPRTGHLAILGAPRSGRTTAAVTAAAALTAAGIRVQAISHHPAAFAALTGQPALGSVVDVRDTERVCELLAALAAEFPPGGAPGVLIVDAPEEAEALALAGAGRPLIDALALSGLAHGAILAVTGQPKPSRWLSQFPHRLVLPVASPTDDFALGVPRDQAGARHLPGRACHLGAGAAGTLQISVVEAAGRSVRPGAGQAAAGRSRPESAGALRLLRPPLRVLPLPQRVTDEDLPPNAADAPVWIGLGGPCATPLGLPVEPGLPVGIVGPHGSGRSTALAHLRRRLEAVGRDVRPLTSQDGWPAVTAALSDGAIALVDDLDSLRSPPFALPATGTLIASYTTASAAALRPPTPLFHARPRGVVLWPSQPGSGAAFGPGRAAQGAVELTGGRGPEPPGRGRLVLGGRSYPVQLAA